MKGNSPDLKHTSESNVGHRFLKKRKYFSIQFTSIILVQLKEKN